MDDVRKFLAGWLDIGGDVPSTPLFDGSGETAPVTVTTTSVSTQTLGAGSSEPPGMTDLVQKMKRVGKGNDASTANLTSIYVFVALTLIIHLIF